ncbi:MAG: nucleoside hydrolase [Nitrospirae bacterium]|nr:nucleoside hydrolase [Nitrospirota bacterium]
MEERTGRRWTRWLLAAAAPAFSACADGTAEKLLLVIDDDVSIGETAQNAGSYWWGEGLNFTAINEIDGGLEIAYAAHSPGVELLGISTVFGNTWVDRAVESTHEILGVLGRTDIPVYRGAASPEDVETPTPASDFLVRVVRENPGKIVLVASGPLTNIATALAQNPHLLEGVHSFHYLGGAFTMDRFPDMQDYNTSGDPDAFNYLFRYGTRLNLYPDSVTMGAPFTSEDLAHLRTVRSASSEYLVSRIEPWLRLQSTLFQMDGFFPFDMSGLAVVLEPELAGRTEQAAIQADVTGEPMRNLKKGFASIRIMDAAGLPLATVWHDINAEEARRRYRERLGR